MATTVKFSRTVLLLAALLLAGVVTSVQAQTTIPFTFLFDENGHGSLIIGSSITPIQGSLLPDPTNPGQTALTYMLGVSVGLLPNEDLGFTEPGGGLSEVFRSTDGSGNLTGLTADRFIFYSELEPPPSDSDLADHIGIPANARGATIIDSESSIFGTIEFGLFNNTHTGHFIGLSDVDVVPEPSSFLLLGTGLLGIVGYGRRKWNLLRQS